MKSSNNICSVHHPNRLEEGGANASAATPCGVHKYLSVCGGHMTRKAGEQGVKSSYGGGGGESISRELGGNFEEEDVNIKSLQMLNCRSLLY